MQKVRFLIGNKITAALAMLFLLAQSGATAQETEEVLYPDLPPCTIDDPLYRRVNFAGKDLADWPETYHGTVNRVINEHLEQPELKCDGASYEELLKTESGSQLQLLAKTLPPWDTEGERRQLKQSDMSMVLLEYLRVYECALEEYKIWAPEIEHRNLFQVQVISNPLTWVARFADVVENTEASIRLIEAEMKTARTTLYYSINLIAAYDRLRPLQAEIDCVQRASLDIRNVTALSAEVSACLPRVWSPKDPLRDLK